MEPVTRIAGAFLRAVGDEGLTPPPQLRLLSLGDPDHPAPAGASVLDGPDALGPMHERLCAGDDRVRRGAWYTPRWLADELVGRVVAVDVGASEIAPVPAQVLDPSCGGGVFLLATADRLVDGPGVAPADVIGRLHGRDVDPSAVAVTEAAMWWWAARRGAPDAPLVDVEAADGLLDPWPRVDVVVGNPPFLSQLRGQTARDGARRAALRDRFGAALRPYTDEAWLFLLAAADAVEAGGRVALLQPRSLLAARDAGAVRAEIDERATLIDLWLDPGDTFDAGVTTCAPILATGVGGGRGNDWLAPVARAGAVPFVDLVGGQRVDEVATVVAGFRDEYYGLVDAVSEGGPGPALVTSGAIDPLRRSGRPVRFAKRAWHDPRVALDAVAGRARTWVETQRGPKLIVASQTKVLECLVDDEDAAVAGVPAIVVRPHDIDDLWLLAAALHAPAVSAWLRWRSPGTGLGRDSCRPTAALVSEIPLPTDRDAWETAAAAACALAAGGGDWPAFARLADAAYGVDDHELRRWWLERLPFTLTDPSGSTPSEDT